MQAITKLMSSVGVFIDLMGNFKLSPELQKRAEKVLYLNRFWSPIHMLQVSNLDILSAGSSQNLKVLCSEMLPNF